MFGVGDAVFAFDVNQHEVVLPAPEHGEAFGITEGGIDLKALEGKDTVTQRTDGLSRANVEDCALAGCGGVHCLPISSLFRCEIHDYRRVVWREHFVAWPSDDGYGYFTASSDFAAGFE